MSTAAKKARKRAHREAGYSADTAYEHEPKRPTTKYRDQKARQAARRREREIEDQNRRMTDAVLKLTRSRKSVDEVMDR